MLSFRDYLEEKLITFGGKAYPRFNNAVIMGGGAGSGKGFVKDKLIGLEGFVFDVDELKRLVSKTPIIVKRIREEMGINLIELSSSLKDPKNVTELHRIIKDELSLDDRRKESLYRSILQADLNRKPNVIFDITMKKMRQLKEYSDVLDTLGYDKKNIHLVWVINDVNVAKKQNLERDRVVPEEILVDTHEGASRTMKELIDMGKDASRYLDGDIAMVFNKKGGDTNIVKSNKGGSFVSDANYLYIKRRGKPIDTSGITKNLQTKIASYVPDGSVWTK